MEKFSFFNDVNDDRVYYAEDWARHLKKYFTNGIFNNELNVVANNDMTITIKEGDANIEGYRYTNTGDLVKTIDNADGTLNRIDNVVLRLDLTNRLISAQIIKGTFADKPVAPELVRTSTIYDLRIAKISIPAGTTTITQDLITDTRFITSDCGNVISTVQTPDTENLFIQMQTLFEKQINELNNNFEIWFDSIKNQLDSDAAGNLQNQINNLNSNKVDAAKYDLDSNNLQLLANGKNVGDSVHIPTGITDTATGEEDLKIVNNKGVVKFSLEGKTEQKSYTGKNVIPLKQYNYTTKGVTVTTDIETGIITINGTCEEDNTAYVIYDDFILNGSYTFNLIYLSGTISNTTNTTRLHIADKDWGNQFYLPFVNSNNYTSRENISNVTYKNHYIRIDKGVTFNNYKVKVQLVQGTNSDYDFEPYVGGTQSPNPDYPQEIKNVRGVENIWFGGESTTNNGITFTKNADGSYDITGTATAEANCFNYINIANTKLKNGINYNLSINKLTNGKVIILTEAYANETWDSHVINTLNTSNSFLTNKIINIKDNITRVRYGIRVEKGQTVNIKGLKIQLEEGPIAHDFVPNGSNYLQLEDKTENLIGLDNKQYRVNLKKGDKIFAVNNGTTNLNLNLYTNYGDITRNDFFTIAANSQRLIVIANNSHAIAWGGTLDNNAWVVKGEKFIPYEQYQEKIINVDLKGNELCSDKEQTLKDELLVENGKAKIIKKYDEVVLNGTEDFGKTEEGFVLVTNDWGNKNKSATLSNYFTTYTNYSEFKEAKEGAGFLYENVNNFYIKIDGATTVNEFRAKLKSLYNAGTPVKVQYELAEPKVIDLGKVDFELLEGNSTLNLEEDLKSNMSIKYYTDSTVVDLKKKLENKQNVILHGTTAPSNDLGEDGDIYLQHN